MTKSDIQFLKDLAQKLKTQDTFSTRKPVIYTIKDFKWEKADPNHENYDRSYARVVKGDTTTDMSIDQLLEMGHELVESEEDHSWIANLMGYLGQVKEPGEKWEDAMTNYEIIELGARTGSIHHIVDVRFERRVEYTVPGTFFLTKDAAEEHIKENQHRYTKYAFLFVHHVFRSTEIERLLELIEKEDWGAYGWDAPEEEA